jgi:exosortase
MEKDQSGIAPEDDAARRALASVATVDAAIAPAGNLESRGRHSWVLALVGTLLACAFAWSYWPTLVSLVQTWDREPDYSHGFLVVPFAAVLLWMRRDRFPGLSGRLAWVGLLGIAASIALRYIGAKYFLAPVDAWSMLPWIAGAVWFLAGPRVCWWCLPAVVFLWFMVPLPFRAERMLSLPLQTIATQSSCWVLQTLGQEAIPVGHTILLGSVRLEVEQACSGLRIFVGIGALSVAYVMAIRQAWWQKLAMLASAVPVALIANALRVVITVILYRYASDEAAKKFSHDAAGWVTTLLAAVLFGLVTFYLHRLIREVEVTDVRGVLRHVYGAEQRDLVRPNEEVRIGRSDELDGSHAAPMAAESQPKAPVQG